MNPLEFYAIVAGLAGYSLHKRWWGAFFFFCSMLVWLLLMQAIIAYAMHPGIN